MALETIRPDVMMRGVFGDRSALNETEGHVVSRARGNPGAASAMSQLADVPGGREALERLLSSADTHLTGPEVWMLFKDVCGENPVVFREAVNQYLDAKGF